ncbi:DoxX family protein [Nguyenibacter sp. L1]|uniref:DoxX family protein n=1 Tax=Nguyenibacter sp. L1 TaxID=3049350 RepID=UPI002B4A03F7|nr:DoxX family protein [Nguyenibacter sp. L1]WRH87818.1 DoxX family protein [Nguyenibacter sp. L1]
MPVVQFITVVLPVALGLVMIGTGGANFAGLPLARRNFALWGYPAGFHRVAGSVGVAIGLLLLIPLTSHVGALASAVFMLAAVATLIRGRDWGHLPVAAILMAMSAAAIAIYGSQPIAPLRCMKRG